MNDPETTNRLRRRLIAAFDFATASHFRAIADALVGKKGEIL